MPLLPRRRPAPADPAGEAPVVQAVADVVAGRPRPKGRPTPKRRDSTGQRGPAAPPPRTRKEAYAWQKQQTTAARTGGTAKPALSREAHREALRRGDPSVLPRRDQGPLKALARDYVDTHVMLSNYLLLAFIPLILGPFVGAGNVAVGQGLQFATFAILLIVLVEWYVTGRKLRRIGAERGLELSGTPLGLGFYAGSRAYLPRRWRLPAPRKARGDQF